VAPRYRPCCNKPRCGRPRRSRSLEINPTLLGGGRCGVAKSCSLCYWAGQRVQVEFSFNLMGKAGDGVPSCLRRTARTFFHAVRFRSVQVQFARQGDPRLFFSGALPPRSIITAIAREYSSAFVKRLHGPVMLPASQLRCHPFTGPDRGPGMDKQNNRAHPALPVPQPRRPAHAFPATRDECQSNPAGTAWILLTPMATRG